MAATSAAGAAGASFVWSAVIPDDRTTGPGRRGGAELLVRLTGGGYVPVIVVRHRVSDRGSGALTTPLPVTDPRQAVVDQARKPRSQPRTCCASPTCTGCSPLRGGVRVRRSSTATTAG